MEDFKKNLNPFEKFKPYFLVCLVFLVSCRETIKNNELYRVTPDQSKFDEVNALFEKQGNFKLEPHPEDKDGLVLEFNIQDSVLDVSVIPKDEDGYSRITYKVENGQVHIIDSNKHPMDKGEEPISYENRFNLQKGPNDKFVIISADFFPDNISIIEDRKIMFTFNPETNELTGRVPENYAGSAPRAVEKLLDGVLSIGRVVKNDKSPKI